MKKLCLIIGLALVLVTSSAYAQVIFEDSFDYANGTAIDGNNGWSFQTNAAGHPGPVAMNGVAVWDMAGEPGESTGELALKRQLGTRDSGTLNAYFDIKLNSVIDGVDQGSNIGMIKFFSSTGAESWRLGMYSGTDWTVGDPYNSVDVLGTPGAWQNIAHPGMGEYVSIWTSINITAKTFTVNMMQNGAWVQTGSYGWYPLGGADIARMDWVGFPYKDLKGFDSASMSLDNVGVYMNETRPVVTPEPSSFMALGMFGLGALGFIKRRRA